MVWIFANRRLCIAFFTLFISYPLSLYRDISKLAKTSGLALIAIGVIIVSVAIEGPKVPQELRGNPHDMFNFANNEIVQGIAVISFGKCWKGLLRTLIVPTTQKKHLYAITIVS